MNLPDGVLCILARPKICAEEHSAAEVLLSLCEPHHKDFGVQVNITMTRALPELFFW